MLKLMGAKGGGVYFDRWVCSPILETPTHVHATYSCAERLNLRLKLTRTEIALLSAVVLFADGKSDQ